MAPEKMLFRSKPWTGELLANIAYVSILALTILGLNREPGKP